MPKNVATRLKKPYPSFPLYVHKTNCWAKTINGRTHYFGRGTPEEAEKLFIEQRADLYAGRKPKKRAAAGDGFTVAQICNRFLIDKKTLLETREISERAWNDYYETSKAITKCFGRHRRIDDLDEEDFGDLRKAIAKNLGLVRLSNEIGRVRTILNYAGPGKLRWISQPIHYGPMFRRPSAQALEIERSVKGDMDLPREVIETVLSSKRTSPQLRAMTLLGVNCGLGNHDCAALEAKCLDLENGWAKYPRPKNGKPRKSKLWPETVAAIEAVLKQTGNSETVFRTKYGNAWVGKGNSCPISKAFRKILDAEKVYEPGRSFYSLRRTLQTQAEECGDFPAIMLVMGHRDRSMSGRYRQRISDERLERVANTVRDWLQIGLPAFGAKPLPGDEQELGLGEIREE